MDNLGNLKQLLESGIITKDEYTTLINRTKKQDGDYDELWVDILNEFYEWCIKDYSIVTAKGYKTCLYKFVLYITKIDNNNDALNQKFETFTFRIANNFLKSLQDKSYSNQTISKTKYAIILLCKFLNQKGIDCPDISKIKVSIKNEVNNTTIALSHDEINKIANVGDLRNKVCILLAYEGALRRVELSKVKVGDFNFNKNQLYVYKGDGSLDRVCILSQETTDVVKVYINELYNDIDKWNRGRISKGKEPREDFGYIFQSIKMIVPSYALLHTMLKENAHRYYESLGVDDINDKISKVTFEILRNSRKVYLLSKGININDVMQLCGDSNYMSTYRFVKLVPVIYPNAIVVE